MSPLCELDVNSVADFRFDDKEKVENIFYDDRERAVDPSSCYADSINNESSFWESTYLLRQLQERQQQQLLLRHQQQLEQLLQRVEADTFWRMDVISFKVREGVSLYSICCIILMSFP